MWAFPAPEAIESATSKLEEEISFFILSRISFFMERRSWEVLMFISLHFSFFGKSVSDLSLTRRILSVSKRFISAVICP